MKIKFIFCLLLFFIFTGCSEATNKQISETSELHKVTSNIGTVFFGSSATTINIILDFNLKKGGKYKISLENEKNGIGVLFGEGNSLLKLGTIENETILIPEQNGLSLWAQFPVRFLEDGKAMSLKVTDNTTGKEIFNKALLFK